MSSRPGVDVREERPERIAQRAKNAATATPLEHAADAPGRSTNNPPPSTVSYMTDVQRRARGARS